MFSLVLFFPLISALLSGFGGRFIGAYWAARMTTFFILSTFFICCFAFCQVGLSGETIVFK